MTDLTTGIRRAATPERAAGPAVPSTAGVNSGDPKFTPPAPVKNVGAVAPAFPSAKDGAHKSNGWHELSDVEFRAYTETLVALTLGAGDSIALDPTRAQVWRIRVTGAATIEIPRPTFPEPSTIRQDAPERLKTWSCVLIVKVATGAPFPTITGASWAEGETAPNVALPDGTAPTDYAGTYAFTFVYDPVDNDVYGFEGGARF